MLRHGQNLLLFEGLNICVDILADLLLFNSIVHFDLYSFIDGIQIILLFDPLSLNIVTFKDVFALLLQFRLTGKPQLRLIQLEFILEVISYLVFDHVYVVVGHILKA